MDEAAKSSLGVLSTRSRQVSMATNDGKSGFHITDLPAVVLSSILVHLEEPVDVVSTLCTCRLFRFLIYTTPFRLRVRHRQSDDTLAANCEDGESNWFTPQTRSYSWTQAALNSIQTHMCATRELDLAGCFILDDNVATILANLLCLERLILNNCQKLTSAVADVLATSVKSGPLSVSLQRCFGLGSPSIGNLLVASAADGSKIRSILLSHLDSLDIPHNDPTVSQSHNLDFEWESRRDDSIAKTFQRISNGTGLRILALNNCAGLATAHFISVAMLCPSLELLLLGGSVQALGLSRVEAVSQDTISLTASSLVRVIELLPRLRVLELTFFTPAVVHAVREQDIKKIQIWDFCEESSVAAAAWLLDRLKKVKPGSAVNDLLQNFASPLHYLNSSQAQAKSPILFSKSIRTQFWHDGIALSDCRGARSFAYSNFSAIGKSDALLDCPQNDGKWDSSPEDVAFGLCGGANCSDVRNRTPLHMAAARGDVPMIAGLLAIGAAVVGMKDSSGSTALFVAAESGYAQACELLLQSGADVLASNRAGETPLYIAALRGHSGAIGVMLAHCHERGVNWQEADVYGMPLLPHIVPSLGGRNFTRRSLKMYPGVGLPYQTLQARVGSRCFSRLWEPASDASHGSQVGDRFLPASETSCSIALQWPTMAGIRCINVMDGLLSWQQRSRIAEMWERCCSGLRDLHWGWGLSRRGNL